MRAVAALLPTLLAAIPARSAATQTQAADRLLAFAQQLAQPRAPDPRPPAEPDLDVLDEAQILPAEFADAGTIAIAAEWLRLVDSLAPDNLPAIEAFARAPEQRPLALVFGSLVALRQRWDTAANIIVDAAEAMPPAQRCHRVVDAWTRLVRHNDRVRLLTVDWEASLLRCYQRGDEQQRAAIADILRRPDLSMEDAKQRLLVLEQTRGELLVGALPPRREPDMEPVWIEDHGELRQVRRHRIRQRPPDRSEIRLAVRDDRGAQRVWGKLQGPRLSFGENESGQLLAIRQLGQLADDPELDFDAGIGPVMIYQSSAAPELPRRRCEAIAEALTAALAASTIAVESAAVEETSREAASQDLVAMARAAVAASRAAARRLAELTTASPPAADAAARAADADVLDSLHQVQTAAVAQLLEWRAAAIRPESPSSWSNMTWTETDSTGELRGQTRTTLPREGGPLRIVQIVAQTNRNTAAVRVSVTAMELLTADLRDARYTEVQTREATNGLVVQMHQPTRERSAGIGLPPLSEASIWCESRPEVHIACDSPEHRRQLQAALQRFAGQ